MGACNQVGRAYTTCAAVSGPGVRMALTLRSRLRQPRRSAEIHSQNIPLPLRLRETERYSRWTYAATAERSPACCGSWGPRPGGVFGSVERGREVMGEMERLQRAPIEVASALSAGVAGSTGNTAEILQKLLCAVRSHLGMEAAFVSKFEHGQRVFEVVDSAPGACTLPVGGSDPLEESFCQRVADGRLPELICNAQELPAALELAATQAFPVGAHLSVPLRLGDGSVYGTFCCFSRCPDYSLNARDNALMRTFAEIASSLIERDLLAAESDCACQLRVQAMLRDDAMSILYQPIVDLETQCVVGFESLARFSSIPPRGPDLCFADASRFGVRDELEARAIVRALAPGMLSADAYLACNVSPDVVLRGHLPAALYEGDLSRIVLEITEHSSVQDYARLDHLLRPLRARGMRLSVDDAGAGHSSLRHILCLQPDFIKLDMSLTRGIDTDRARRALAAALIGFARETGSELIAEGVETVPELATLRELGVGKGQGYLLGRPAPFAAARALLEPRV